MPDQITFCHDVNKVKCWNAPETTIAWYTWTTIRGLIIVTPRVEIALLESGASYTTCGFDIYNKPAWFAKVNPLTGKILAVTYGGPNVLPEEPSLLSFKLTESFVILEFLADLFPNSHLLPPASNRLRVLA